ncbi:hypothetical protein E0485_04760 [Paenibacillus albiflavus]|uniref:WG repeat-containing protein n=1 Tax=Paenibacillus albiflavus TaxID=2545760 RepID=A0A4R4EJ18_9BACL|nr:hypothetical protein [Paenibacillus albiflavus]TCZ80164.1 hypothetical protein E0485_04760 [Paenibacillus albiflavus]
MYAKTKLLIIIVLIITISACNDQPDDMKLNERLSYTFSSKANDNMPFLLLRGKEYDTRLLIPDHAHSVELAFSEAMENILPVTNVGTSINAKWRDDNHLLIPLDKTTAASNGNQELILNFKQLKSVAGKYIDSIDSKLRIQLVPQYEWYNGSGERLEEQPRDRFYDQLISSPDGQSYIGVVLLGGQLEEGDGKGYSFVLEQPYCEPIVIEDAFLSTIDWHDLPLQWLDSNTILYGFYGGVYAYDIAQGKRTVLYDVDKEMKHTINYAEYDSARKQLQVLVYKDHKAPSNQLDLLTYELGKDNPIVTPDFTQAVHLIRFTDLRMRIIPTDDGTYWTRGQGGLPYTDFIDHAGNVLSTEGYIRGITGQGVYLERFKKGEYDLESNGWFIWTPGKSERAITLLPDVSRMFFNGQDLIALQNETYFRYDLEYNKWVEWVAPNGAKYAEPIRGANGLYRVKKD